MQRTGSGEGEAVDSQGLRPALDGDNIDPAAGRTPRTGGRPSAHERRRRLEVWGTFINDELAARGMRPTQLAVYANVNASTVSMWRHQKSLPNRNAVLGVARCFQLPVAVVAERAGILPPDAVQTEHRMTSDTEWRMLLARIDRLPEGDLRHLKAALSRAVRAALDGERRERSSF